MYKLFAGDNHYPRGGYKDFIDSYDTLEEALEHAANARADWWQIVLYDKIERESQI